MYSKLNLRLLAAVMLAAALPLCVPAAPLEVTPTDLSPDEASGSGAQENQGTPQLTDNRSWIIKTLEQVIASSERIEKKFEVEFCGNHGNRKLDSSPSFPNECQRSNFSEEACLQRVGQGLLVYSVLLKYVDGEYPDSSAVTEVNATIPLLITKIKSMMINGDLVVALTCSQEQQLLDELDNPDLFHRKKKAHCIIKSIRDYFVDSKRLFKWLMARRQ